MNKSAIWIFSTARFYCRIFDTGQQKIYCFNIQNCAKNQTLHPPQITNASDLCSRMNGRALLRKRVRLCVRLCEYLWDCMYICEIVRIFLWVCVWDYTCVDVYECKIVCTCVKINVRVCVHECEKMCVSDQVCVSVCVCMKDREGLRTSFPLADPPRIGKIRNRENLLAIIYLFSIFNFFPFWGGISANISAQSNI